MSLEDVFVRDVLDNPEDDAVRLIYADWLTDQLAPDKAARGDFIHLQCQRAHLPADDPEACEMLAVERELLAEYQAAWVGGLADEVERFEFRRGFVEGVTLSASSFLARADQLFGLGPIRQVSLRQAGSVMGLLARCERLASITHLGLRDNGLSGSDLAELVASHHLHRLNELDLSRNPLGSVGVQALGGREALHALQGLRLTGCELGPAGVLALCRGRSRNLAARERGLGLRIATLHLADNALGPEGAQILKDELLGTIYDLDLSRNHLGVSGLAHLLGERPRRWQPSLLGSAKHLNLSGNDIAPAGAEILAHCHYLSYVTSLTLNQNNLGDDGADALVLPRYSSNFERLSELSLAGNGIGPAGMKALLGLTCLPRLTLLNLDNNLLGADGAELIACCPELAGLATLNLGRNRLGPAGVENLAASPHLTKLKRLDVSGNGIGERGIRALLKAPNLAGLVELQVSGNRLNEEQVRRLRARFGARLRA